MRCCLSPLHLARLSATHLTRSMLTNIHPENIRQGLAGSYRFWNLRNLDAWRTELDLAEDGTARFNFSKTDRYFGAFEQFCATGIWQHSASTEILVTITCSSKSLGLDGWETKMSPEQPSEGSLAFEVLGDGGSCDLQLAHRENIDADFSGPLGTTYWGGADERVTAICRQAQGMTPYGADKIVGNGKDYYFFQS